MTLRLIATSVVAAAAAAFIAGCASVTPVASQPLTTAPAPVTFDGNVAGQATDYVFVLVPDTNPATPGLALRAGETLQLALPAGFKRNTAVAVSADTDLNLVLTKGWAQGAVRLAGQYRVGYDDSANAMKVTALVDVPASGANAPGIKVIHLRGRTFVNPMPGDYAVTVTHAAPDARVLARWQGQLKVLDSAPAARLAPSNFQLPPGVNGDYQKVPTGSVAPQTLGLLLWGANGSAMNGVGIAPRDLARFPKYTGGLLMQADRVGSDTLLAQIVRMVGDAQILVPQLTGGLGHLFQRALAIRRRRVVVEHAVNVVEHKKRGQSPLGGGLDLARVLAKFGGNVGEVKRPVDVGFFLASDALLRARQLVFVEPQSALDGALPTQ